jgi:alanine racemase
MKAKHLHATWVEVDLQVLKDNINIIQRYTKTPLMAVVKANGYGHGFIPIAKAAEEVGVNWFGVARPRMAVKMREEGIQGNLLILGYICPERLEEMIKLDVSITIWTKEHISLTEKAARKAGNKARVHLLVDSGMGRLGCMPDEALQLAELAQGSEWLHYEGLFSHLACADEEDPNTTREQWSVFNRVIQEFTSQNLLPEIIHMANSAGSLVHPDTRFNLIRPGLSIYGLSPSLNVILPDGIKPVLSWKSVLASIKRLPPGHGVSYGHDYVTSKDELIGVVPLGYADGYRRVPGNVMLINGVKVPVVGRVSMDQCMVQLDGIPNPQIGDEVVLIGTQGEEEISVNDLAKTWNTINYEVTCGIGSRVPRIYPSN